MHAFRSSLQSMVVPSRVPQQWPNPPEVPGTAPCTTQARDQPLPPSHEGETHTQPLLQPEDVSPIIDWVNDVCAVDIFTHATRTP